MAWQILLLLLDSVLSDRIESFTAAPHLQLIQRQLLLLKPAKNRSWEEAQVAEWRLFGARPGRKRPRSCHS